jgi:hypothetical protein
MAIEPANRAGINQYAEAREGDHPRLTRTDAAREAGFCDHQHKTALRVAVYAGRTSHPADVARHDICSNPHEPWHAPRPVEPLADASLALPFTHKSSRPGELIAEEVAFAHVLEMRISQPHQLVTRRGILAPCQVAADDGDQLDAVSQTRGRLPFFLPHRRVER